MALNFYEREDSRAFNRTVNNAKETLHFIALYTLDEDAVYATALIFGPIVWDGLPRQALDAKPLGGGIWDVSIEYGFSSETQNDKDDPEANDKNEPDDSTPLGPEFDFDITAQSVHITQSLKTVRAIAASASPGMSPILGWTPFTKFAVGDQVVNFGNQFVATTAGTSGAIGPSGAKSGITDGTAVWNYQSVDFQLDPRAPVFNQAIGVTKDSVVGTDVFTGHMEFGTTVQVFPILLPYLRILLNAVGTTNIASWFEFPAGTLLYLGATGSCKPGELWTLHHKFAAAPNLANIPITPSLLIPMKRGFEYLWCLYRDQVGSNGITIQVPAAAYVEQVYRESDYSLLGLGA